MKKLVSCMKLDELEGANTRRYFIDSSGTKEMKNFTSRHTFGIHFRYRKQVDDYNNWRPVSISLEKTPETNFWHDNNFFWYIEMW